MPTAATTAACARFLDAIWAKDKLNDAEAHALMDLAMAATYDPDPRTPLGFRLPFDLETGELMPDALGRWRGNDPDQSRRRATRATCARCAGIYIDCGWRDQYHLHFGARILSKRARRSTASRTRTRSSTTRIRRSTTGWTSSLPFLYRALKP